MKTTFYYDEDLVGAIDSMEFDSEQSVAELTINDIVVELRVVGDVRVVFNDDSWRTPSQFPDELKEIIRKGTLGTDERVYVDMNNWFEMFIYKNDEWTGWSDVVDGGWKSGGEIFDTLLEYGKTYLEEN